MRSVFLVSLLIASPALAAGPITGGAVASYIDQDYGGPIPPVIGQQFSTDGGTGINVASGLGASNSIIEDSRAWLDRLSITSNAQNGFVFGAGKSLFAVNQMVTGAPGAIAHLSYTFKVDGSFTPGPAEHYIPLPYAPRQFVNFSVSAHAGTANSLSVQTDAYGDYLLFDASDGQTSISRFDESIGYPGQPGYFNTFGDPIANADLCDFVLHSRCADGGTFDDVMTIAFDIPVGENFYVGGGLQGRTDGEINFFDTARLQSISLAPEFGLISDDGGALVRNPNGMFHLAVPEPESWMLMIAGFGAVGVAARRRRPNTAAAT